MYLGLWTVFGKDIFHLKFIKRFNTSFWWTVVRTKHTGLCTACKEFCKYAQARFASYQLKQLSKC